MRPSPLIVRILYVIGYLLAATGSGISYAVASPDAMDPILDRDVTQAIPDRQTGILNIGGYRGSGVVAVSPRLVLSAAHIGFEDTSFRWPSRNFFKAAHHDSDFPPESEMTRLRGAYALSGYGDAVRDHGTNSAQAFEKDLIVRYATTDLIDDAPAARMQEAAGRLKQRGSKQVTGYPVGFYGDDRDHPHRYLMHRAGPFDRTFATRRGRFLEVLDVHVEAGASGGPVWVERAARFWDLAGIVVSSLQSPFNGREGTGVIALDGVVWELIDQVVASHDLPVYDHSSDGTLSWEGTSAAAFSGTEAALVLRVSEPDAEHAVIQRLSAPGGMWETIAPALEPGAAKEGVVEVVVHVGTATSELDGSAYRALVETAAGERVSDVLTLTVFGTPRVSRSDSESRLRAGDSTTIELDFDGRTPGVWNWEVARGDSNWQTLELAEQSFDGLFSYEWNAEDGVLRISELTQAAQWLNLRVFAAAWEGVDDGGANTVSDLVSLRFENRSGSTRAVPTLLRTNPVWGEIQVGALPLWHRQYGYLASIEDPEVRLMVSDHGRDWSLLSAAIDNPLERVVSDGDRVLLYADSTGWTGSVSGDSFASLTLEAPVTFPGGDPPEGRIVEIFPIGGKWVMVTDAGVFYSSNDGVVWQWLELKPGAFKGDFSDGDVVAGHAAKGLAFAAGDRIVVVNDGVLALEPGAGEMRVVDFQRFDGLGSPRFMAAHAGELHVFSANGDLYQIHYKQDATPSVYELVGSMDMEVYGAQWIGTFYLGLGAEGLVHSHDGLAWSHALKDAPEAAGAGIPRRLGLSAAHVFMPAGANRAAQRMRPVFMDEWIDPDGWRWAGGIGWFFPFSSGEDGWFYQAERGWIYRFAGSPGGFYLYGAAEGWIWTSYTALPWAFFYEEGAWAVFER